MLVLVLAGLFFVIFGGVGIALLVYSQSAKKKAAQAKAWPTTPGVVNKAELSKHTHYDHDSHTNDATFEPVVEYTYSAQGQTYTGTHIAFGASSFDYRTAQKKINAYPPGSAVKVFYDPQNPSNAVLEPAASGSLVLSIVGGIFLVIGLMVCCIGGISGVSSLLNSGEVIQGWFAAMM